MVGCVRGERGTNAEDGLVAFAHAIVVFYPFLLHIDSRAHPMRVVQVDRYDRDVPLKYVNFSLMTHKNENKSVSFLTLVQTPKSTHPLSPPG